MSFLPFTTLQPTYPEVFNDISSSIVESDTVWLSIYQGNAPNASIHSKLNLSACRQDDRDPNTRAGVRIEKLHTKGSERLKVHRKEGNSLNLDISVPPSSSANSASSTPVCSARRIHSQIIIPFTTLQLPRRTLSSKPPGALGITASDVSPSGNGLLVLGGEDGWLEVRNLNHWDFDTSSTSTSNENEKQRQGEAEAEDEYLNEQDRIEALAQRRMREKLGNTNLGSDKETVKLKGHKGDIRSVRFFPSGEVILSTSSDCTARIFSAIDGSNPRVLKGHKRAIMCCEFIDRGKEVLTGGMDGTIRLWNVSEEKQTAIFGSDRYSGVECMKLIQCNQKEKSLLIIGLSSSKLQMLDLKTSKTLRLVNLPLFPPGEKPNASDGWKQTSFGAITCLDYHRDSNWIVAGGRNGGIAIYDLKRLNIDEEEVVGKGEEEESSIAVEEISNPSIPIPSEEKTDWNERAMIAFWKRNEASINEVRFIQNSHHDDATINLLVATADGLPHRISLENLQNHNHSSSRGGQHDLESSLSNPDSQPKVLTEYCGWEVENTQSILHDPSWGKGQGGGRVIVSGAHGEVRIY